MNYEPRLAFIEGYRYLSPVATPAEVAALRAERDAAVEDARCLRLLVAHNEGASATLRAEVGRLRMFLANAVNSDTVQWLNGAEHKAARAALEPKP